MTRCICVTGPLSFRHHLSDALLRRRPHRRIVIVVNERVSAMKATGIYLRTPYNHAIIFTANNDGTFHRICVFRNIATSIRARYSGRGLIDLSAELIVRPTTICRAGRPLCLIVSLSKRRCIVMRFPLAMTALAMTSCAAGSLGKFLSCTISRISA